MTMSSEGTLAVSRFVFVAVAAMGEVAASDGYATPYILDFKPQWRWSRRDIGRHRVDKGSKRRAFAELFGIDNEQIVGGEVALQELR